MLGNKSGFVLVRDIGQIVYVAELCSIELVEIDVIVIALVRALCRCSLRLQFEDAFPEGLHRGVPGLEVGGFCGWCGRMVRSGDPVMVHEMGGFVGVTCTIQVVLQELRDELGGSTGVT